MKIIKKVIATIALLFIITTLSSIFTQIFVHDWRIGLHYSILAIMIISGAILILLLFGLMFCLFEYILE
jgi:cytochrome c biogenesis protein CcdA